MDNIRHIEWYGYNETVISLWVAIFVVLMCLAILLVPRKRAIVPAIIVALFVTSMQRIVVGGLDFHMLRFVTLFGLARIIVRSEYRELKFNRIDLAVIIYVSLHIVTYTILIGNVSALVNRLGNTCDFVGYYALGRCFITGKKDMDATIRVMALLSIPVAILMLSEQVRGTNVFAFMGGVPEMSEVRDGRIRSQGAFAHEILAGTYGAMLVPLLMALRSTGRDKLNIAVGLVAASLIMFTSASSGALLAYASGIAALCLWPLRRLAKAFLWGGGLAAVALHMYMKDPVWAIIYRLTPVSGSTGYHRFMLIDQAIRRISEWWLWGTTSMATWGWGLQDVTSQYVRVAVDGGVFTLIAFVCVIIASFRLLAAAARAGDGAEDMQQYLWAIGASLLVHLVSFVGVSYFGQMVFFYYALVGAIASLCASFINPPPDRTSGDGLAAA